MAAAKTTAAKSATATLTADQGALAALRNAVASSGKGNLEDLTTRPEAIPTGSLGLDVATGIGGFPVGRIIELYGMESSGKSTVVYHTIAQAQKRGFLCLLIDTEGALDPTYMRRIGVNLDDLIVWSPDSQEAAIDMLVHATKASNGRLLTVIDSVAALAPETMMEESADKKFRGTAANVWSQQMPKIIAALRNTKTTLILVNQMRESMDLYAAPSTPGGKAIKFAASMRVLMRRKVDKGEKDNLDGAVGQEIQFIIEKNKVSNPFRKGFAYLERGRPVDPVDDVIERGIERGVIQADTKFEDGELLSKKQWFTIVQTDAMVSAIKKDLARAERDKVDLPASGGQPILREDEPIVAYRKNLLAEVLDFAPNLVDALREAILATLDTEASLLDVVVSPYDAALADRAKQFDAGADDGQTSEAITKEIASKDKATNAGDDDLAEFDEK